MMSGESGVNKYPFKWKIYSSKKIEMALDSLNLDADEVEKFFSRLHSKKERDDAPLATHPKTGGRSVWPGTRKKILERDGFACVKCGSKSRLTMDHIIPSSRGGTSRFGNLQTLCMPCNSSKRDRTNEEWAAS